jgi:hypothetical protein
MTTNDDLRTALAEDDGSLPERWNPDDEPGTTVIGTLVRYETIVTSQGEGTIAVIEDDAGTEWGVALFRTVLKKRFEQFEPRLGDTVGVKFVGWVEPRNKDARGYFNYVVKVSRGNTLPPVRTDAEAAAELQQDTSNDELPF